MFKGDTYWLGLLVILLCSPAISEQLCRTETEIPPSTPTSQFIQHNNGTVTDTATRLVWMRCSLGQTWDGTACQGDVQLLNWQQALQAPQTTNFAEYNNWRLPNIKELASIIEEACYNPAINLTIFPNTFFADDSGYWSSSQNGWSSQFFGAWILTFIDGSNGISGEGSYGRPVRLVRSGDYR